MPAYNRPALTARAVKSALAQQPSPPAEVLVIDDCSSDDTAAAAEAAGATVIRRETNGGESAARNTGFEQARHDWIATLDSDDEWTPDHLSNLLAASDGHVLLSSSALAIADHQPPALSGLPNASPLPLRTPADLIFPRNPVIASGALVRRDIALEVGGFTPGMTRCADLDLWLRVLERGTGLVLPEPSVLYRLHEGQVSNDRGAMRRAHRDVVAAYQGRPWFDHRLLERLDGMNAWDDVNDAVRERDLAGIRRALRAMGRPSRLRGVAAALIVRQRTRRSLERYRSYSDSAT